MIDEQKEKTAYPEDTSGVSEEKESVNSEAVVNDETTGERETEFSIEDAEPTSNDSPVGQSTTEPEEQTATQEGTTAEDSEVVEALNLEIQALKQQLEQQNQQTDSYKTQYVRLAADFDNFRKRSQKEKEDLEQQIKRNTLSELLSVVDNFERARAQIKPQTDGEMNIHKSYQSVYKQLVDSLKRLGVSAMRPEGKEFDPNLHEAVIREATNEHPEGTVIEQLMRGYM
ncbi:MAG: nucleotide exchange factor GrpE, partial [Chroococcales cyanobacterium]